MDTELAWAHFDGWAGQRKVPVVIVKRNPKRSRVRFEDGTERLAPNHALTPRTTDPTDAGKKP